MAQVENRNTTQQSNFARSEFTQWASLAERLSQEEVQRGITDDLAAGHTIPYGEIGTEKVFLHVPDGRRFEVHVLEDGSTEIIQQVAE